MSKVTYGYYLGLFSGFQQMCLCTFKQYTPHNFRNQWYNLTTFIVLELESEKIGCRVSSRVWPKKCHVLPVGFSDFGTAPRASLSINQCKMIFIISTF